MRDNYEARGISVGAMTSAQPLRAVIRRLTDRLFFKGRYDSDQLIADLTRIVVNTLDLDKLTSQMLSTILREMRISKGAFLLCGDKAITGIKGIGFADLMPFAAEFEWLFYASEKARNFFLFEELEEGIIKELFRKLEISIAIPIRVEKTEVAILILGPKSSGEVYYERDTRVLSLFASEAGVAIQNAEAYAQIKKFSAELEQRVAERTQQLEESQKQEIVKAQEVARLKDEFVFLAVHELRTPVMAIRGFLELTKDSQQNFPKDIQNNLLAMSQASEHVNQLINDLLEIARSDSGTAKIEVRAEEFKPILDDVLKEVSSLVTEKGITLDVQLKFDPIVLCDAKKLKEVLLNLLSNAIKYNRDKGSVYITVFKPFGEQRMIFEIRDTGYGIPKDQQEKIFQKFFRAVTPETQETLGTGLGLFITRMLVEKMGGTLMFSSIEHEGTTFSFMLPTA